MSLSIGGVAAEWKAFGRKALNGNEILFRSRTHVAAVRACAESHAMTRIRYPLAGAGSEFEGALLDSLEAADAPVFLLAAMTSEGNRDLFFAADDPGQLRSAIAAAGNRGKVTVQFAPIRDTDKAQFLDLLTLTPEMEKAAFAQGRAKPAPNPGSGPFGKPLGR